MEKINDTTGNVEEWSFNCPNCKSDKRIAQIITDEDKKLGRMTDKVDTGVISQTQIPLQDPSKQPKVGDEVSVMIILQDVCAECGTDYIFKVVRKVNTIKMDVSHLIDPRRNLNNMQLPPTKHLPKFHGGG